MTSPSTPGAPASWEDGIALLEQVAFQLRRLLPDAAASEMVTRVENWLVEVRAQYQEWLQQQPQAGS